MFKIGDDVELVNVESGDAYGPDGCGQLTSYARDLGKAGVVTKIRDGLCFVEFSGGRNTWVFPWRLVYGQIQENE